MTTSLSLSKMPLFTRAQMTLAFLVLMLASLSTQAHPIDQQHGTLNIVGVKVYSVLSIAASVLTETSGLINGKLTEKELLANQGLLAKAVETNFSIAHSRLLDIRFQLAEANGHNPSVVIFTVHELDKMTDVSATGLVVNYNLFGKTKSDQVMQLSVARVGDDGKKNWDVAAIGPDSPIHTFFPAEKLSLN